MKLRVVLPLLLVLLATLVVGVSVVSAQEKYIILKLENVTLEVNDVITWHGYDWYFAGRDVVCYVRFDNVPTFDTEVAVYIKFKPTKDVDNQAFIASMESVDSSGNRGGWYVNYENDHDVIFQGYNSSHYSAWLIKCKAYPNGCLLYTSPSPRD